MPHFARIAAGGILVVAAVAFGASTPSGAPGAAQAAPAAQDAAHGQELFSTYGCYQCHGFEGQGASSTGPRIAPNPIAFNRFVDQVYDPRDLMPRYPPEYLSQQDLADIYAYLQSIPAAPDPAQIPLLNQ
ncbi:MAG TPA: cytochrome c [Chloroflexota bacterium]|jgi:ubiquinol-cytochrome c reductase cytochrome c subunit